MNLGRPFAALAGRMPHSQRPKSILATSTMQLKHHATAMRGPSISCARTPAATVSRITGIRPQRRPLCLPRPATEDANASPQAPPRTAGPDTSDTPLTAAAAAARGADEDDDTMRIPPVGSSWPPAPPQTMSTTGQAPSPRPPATPTGLGPATEGSHEPMQPTGSREGQHRDPANPTHLTLRRFHSAPTTPHVAGQHGSRDSMITGSAAPPAGTGDDGGPVNNIAGVGTGITATSASTGGTTASPSPSGTAEHGDQGGSSPSSPTSPSRTEQRLRGQAPMHHTLDSLFNETYGEDSSFGRPAGELGGHPWGRRGVVFGSIIPCAASCISGVVHTGWKQWHYQHYRCTQQLAALQARPQMALRG